MNTALATTTLSLGTLDAGDDQHLTAIHESGHAVMYWRLRRELEFVTAASTAEYVGFTKPVSMPTSVFDYVRAVVAGPVAQAMATFSAAGTGDGETAEDAWDEHVFFAVFTGGQGDLEDLVSRPEIHPQAFATYRATVRNMLTEVWPQVIALAEALVAHPELKLTGAEAFAVMDATLPAGRFMQR